MIYPSNTQMIEDVRHLISDIPTTPPSEDYCLVSDV
jgi:hypothetical protein